MELRQIKELMATMGKTGTSRLEVEREGFKLVLERAGDQPVYVTAADCVSSNMIENPMKMDIEKHRSIASPMKGNASTEVKPVSSDHDSDDNYDFITSPMVGTFYSSAAPGEPTFVKVGDNVTLDSIVCIIEAMKVMNEVKAGSSGSVVELLVEDGHPVEFGTKLVKITKE